MFDPNNEINKLNFLNECGFSTSEITGIARADGWSLERLVSEVKELLSMEHVSKAGVYSDFKSLYPELFGDDQQTPKAQPRKAKRASEFGESKKSFLWYPYLPRGEFTVLMASGGTGKGVFCCGIAAAITSGELLPGDDQPRQPGTVLFISAEDDGEDFRDRLRKSGANLERCQIIDRSDSIGMSLTDHYDEFSATVAYYQPDLVVLDPWHAFLGDEVNINRVNAVRPVFHNLALLAKKQNTSIIAVSHVNKKSQGDNANDAATGSADFVNASRSALKVIFDDTDPELSRRIVVHTKSNFAIYGKSVCFRIIDGGLEWDGYSEVSRSTLEEAARHRKSVGEQLAESHKREDTSRQLIEALLELGENTESCGIRLGYNEFAERFGRDIFGGYQPKRALDSVVEAMENRGYIMETGKMTKHNGKNINCFFLKKKAEGEL